MRHETFYQAALLTGFLLAMGFAVRPALAADPWDNTDNQSGAMPAVPTTPPMSRYDLMREVVPSAPRNRRQSAGLPHGRAERSRQRSLAPNQPPYTGRRKGRWCCSRTRRSWPG